MLMAAVTPIKTCPHSSALGLTARRNLRLIALMKSPTRFAVPSGSAPPSANHEINISAAAFGAPQPRGPFRQTEIGAVAGDLLGNIGLDLMPACLAPND